MKGNYETIVHPLSPLYDENSKILILGSFPSVKTREYGFFYGHPQNRFWKLMEKLFDVDLDVSIEDRKKFLLEHHIAVYDSSIKNVMPSNLKEIVDCANIKHVFCNGTASFKCFERYHAKNLGVESTKLPSTSPANARFRLDDLEKEWKVILEYL